MIMMVAAWLRRWSCANYVSTLRARMHATIHAMNAARCTVVCCISSISPRRDNIACWATLLRRLLSQLHLHPPQPSIILILLALNSAIILVLLALPTHKVCPCPERRATTLSDEGPTTLESWTATPPFTPRLRCCHVTGEDSPLTVNTTARRPRTR